MSPALEMFGGWKSAYAYVSPALEMFRFWKSMDAYASLALEMFRHNMVHGRLCEPRAGGVRALEELGGGC